MDHDDRFRPPPEEEKHIVNVTVNFNGVDVKTLLETVQHIAADVTILKSQGAKMADDFQTLLDDAAQQSTQLDSLKVLVQGLVANQNNPAKLQALVKQFAGNEQKILDVITIGTPAAVLTATPSPLSVAVGATAQVQVTDSTGADVTSTSTYSFPDATVATVSPAGVVTGVTAGTAVLSIANGPSATTVQVTVA